jgi:hypothetical protein
MIDVPMTTKQPQSKDGVLLPGPTVDQSGAADHSQGESVAGLIRRRRRVRMLRFIACEAVAIGIMVASAIAGLSARFATETLTPFFRILPITAAAAATIIPILFYGSAGRRPRG